MPPAITQLDQNLCWGPQLPPLPANAGPNLVTATVAIMSRRQPLVISEAPEPSDVQYENMEHGAWDRFGRTLLTLVCSYTALALGFFLISLTTASRIQVARTAGIDTNDCASCRLTVDGVFGLSADDKVLYQACDKTGKTPAGDTCSDMEKQCYRCFCYSAITSGRLRCAAIAVN